MNMNKLDLKKEEKVFYSPSAKGPMCVEIPPMKYLMVDGHGDPNTAPEYQAALEALFPLAYAIKFTAKKRQGMDFAVMPLEGLWWADDMASFTNGDKSAWDWTMMIRQPDFIEYSLVEEMREQVARKNNPTWLGKIRFDMIHEGMCVQMMHHGPFSAEGPNIAWMHRFAQEQGCATNGKHHEIYLSDFRRTDPEKLRTVLRQPIKRIK
jgi:hypothetical protein